MALSTKQVTETPLDPNLRWLTIRDAARYLQVSPQTVRGIIHDGRLKVVRIGLHFRIDRVDLDSAMMRRKQTVAPYRRGTRPWVKERHAENRRQRRPG